MRRRWPLLWMLASGSTAGLSRDGSTHPFSATPFFSRIRRCGWVSIECCSFGWQYCSIQLNAALGCVAYLLTVVSSCIELLPRLCCRLSLVPFSQRQRAAQLQQLPAYADGQGKRLFPPAELRQHVCLLCSVRPLCRPQVSLTGVDKYAEGVAKLFNQEESRCRPRMRPVGSWCWSWLVGTWLASKKLGV